LRGDEKAPARCRGFEAVGDDVGLARAWFLVVIHAYIQGRTEDTLHLPGAHGAGVAIHPNVIHNVFDGALVGAWQVVQESDGLRVLVAEPRSGFDAAPLGERLRQSLIAQGALATPVLIEQVAAIPRTLNGKAPLIRALSRQVPGR